MLGRRGLFYLLTLDQDAVNANRNHHRSDNSFNVDYTNESTIAASITAHFIESHQDSSLRSNVNILPTQRVAKEEATRIAVYFDSFYNEGNTKNRETYTDSGPIGESNEPRTPDEYDRCVLNVDAVLMH